MHNGMSCLSVRLSVCPGRSWEDKVCDTRSEMKKKGCTVLIVTALDEVAWLLNLRGADIDYNPVFFAYVIVTEADIRYMVPCNVC